MTFALAGNQNCGKTTLFNQLTGSNQHVGNFPGVTVERKDRSYPPATKTLWLWIFPAFTPFLPIPVKKS